MKIKTILLTGRSLRQGIGKEIGKMSSRYLENTSSCEMHPQDMEEIGVKQGDNILVKTSFGSVVVKCVQSTTILKRGIIFIPYGLYASQLIDSSTDSTGMPTFKGITAEVESASNRNVVEVKDVLSKYIKGVLL